MLMKAMCLCAPSRDLPWTSQAQVASRCRQNMTLAATPFGYADWVPDYL